MKSVSYLCIALLFASTLGAQTVTKGSWQTVQSITPGSRVQIHKFGTDCVDGEFRSASVDSVTVESKGGEQTIVRRDVREVKLRKASARLKNAGIGAAVGTGLGAGIGLAIGGRDLDDLGAAILALVTVIGAIAGFGLGFIPAGYGTIYKAAQP